MEKSDSQKSTPLLNSNKDKSKYWRFAISFFGVLVGVYLLYVIGFWAVYYYKGWQSRQAVERLAETLKQAEEKDYSARMADTYGGKTPQETLKMYIDAVGRGNYELASKYFIQDYQDRELKSLQNSPAKNTEEILVLLQQSLDSPGSYSWDKKQYGIEEPLSVDFRLYPNGIWKIIAI